MASDDIVFIVNEERFSAKRSEIAAASDVFSALLEGHFIESKQNEITIPNIKHTASFSNILKYINKKLQISVLQVFTFAPLVFCEMIHLSMYYNLKNLYNALLLFIKASELNKIYHVTFEDNSVVEFINIIHETAQYSYFYKKILFYIFDNATFLVDHESFEHLKYEALLEIIESPLFNVPEANILKAVLNWIEVKKKRHDDLSTELNKKNKIVETSCSVKDFIDEEGKELFRHIQFQLIPEADIILQKYNIPSEVITECRKNNMFLSRRINKQRFVGLDATFSFKFDKLTVRSPIYYWRSWAISVYIVQVGNYSKEFEIYLQFNSTIMETINWSIEVCLKNNHIVQSIAKNVRARKTITYGGRDYQDLNTSVQLDNNNNYIQLGTVNDLIPDDHIYHIHFHSVTNR